MSTPDRLGIALFEVRGRTLPPDVQQPSPRLTLTCHGCGALLAGIYATTVGHLLLSERPREGRRIASDGTLVERSTAVSASMLDQIGDNLELRCKKCNVWRALPDQDRLTQLCQAPPPRRRVVLQ